MINLSVIRLVKSPWGPKHGHYTDWEFASPFFSIMDYYR